MDKIYNTPALPPTQTIYNTNKNSQKYLFDDFYKKLIKTIIDTIKEIKEGKEFVAIFTNEDRLFYYGIILIIISILLLPIVLD